MNQKSPARKRKHQQRYMRSQLKIGRKANAKLDNFYLTDEYKAVLSEMILTDHWDLTPAECKLCMALVRAFRADPKIAQGIDDLVAMSGLSERTVKRCMSGVRKVFPVVSPTHGFRKDGAPVRGGHRFANVYWFPDAKVEKYIQANVLREPEGHENFVLRLVRRARPTSNNSLESQDNLPVEGQNGPQYFSNACNPLTKQVVLPVEGQVEGQNGPPNQEKDVGVAAATGSAQAPPAPLWGAASPVSATPPPSKERSNGKSVSGLLLEATDIVWHRLYGKGSVDDEPKGNFVDVKFEPGAMYQGMSYSGVRSVLCSDLRHEPWEQANKKPSNGLGANYPWHDADDEKHEAWFEATTEHLDGIPDDLVIGARIKWEGYTGNIAGYSFALPDQKDDTRNVLVLWDETTEEGETLAEYLGWLPVDKYIVVTESAPRQERPNARLRATRADAGSPS